MPVRSWSRRGLAVAAAVATVLAVAVTTVSVAAAEPNAEVAADAVPVKAADAPKQDCGLLPPSIGDDEDGWVFVLPNTKWRFASVTATFTTADGATQTRAGTATKPPNGTASSKYYVITPAGWTLTGASAEVEPKVERPGTAPTGFDLLHACAGTPDEPGPDPSSDTPTTPGGESPSSPDTSATATPGPSASDDSGLPVTGNSLMLPLLVGLSLVAAGLVIVIAARRRRDTVI